MLSAIVKESQAKQAKIRANNDRNRKEALAATESVSNLMTESVQESVNEVYGAQNKLEKEVKGLQTNTAHFAKQTYQWLEMIKAFNGSLKVLCFTDCLPPTPPVARHEFPACVLVFPLTTAVNLHRSAAIFRIGQRPSSGT